MIRARIRVLVAAFALATIAATAGCTPSAPAPSPTPSGFADEAEAFAAAEETYRAYVDALNRRRASDETPPTPQDFLVGAALTSDIADQKELTEAGVRVTGESRVDRVIPGDKERDSPGEAWIIACVNSEGTRLIDEAGNDRTPPDRALVSNLEVHLQQQNGRWLIADSQLISEGQC